MICRALGSSEGENISSINFVHSIFSFYHFILFSLFCWFYLKISAYFEFFFNHIFNIFYFHKNHKFRQTSDLNKNKEEPLPLSIDLDIDAMGDEVEFFVGAYIHKCLHCALNSFYFFSFFLIFFFHVVVWKNR